VVGLFQSALEEELRQVPSSGIDIRKVVSEFRNLLEQSCEIVPSFEEDQHAQDIKSKIEACQRRALRIKSSLHSTKSRFVQEVQLETERMLEQQRPVIEPIDLDEDLGLPPDCEANLKILDEAIDQLRAQIGETRSTMDDSIVKVTGFIDQASSFFDHLK
jgi:hypothetical protein